MVDVDVNSLSAFVVSEVSASGEVVNLSLGRSRGTKSGDIDDSEVRDENYCVGDDINECG